MDDWDEYDVITERPLGEGADASVFIAIDRRDDTHDMAGTLTNNHLCMHSFLTDKNGMTQTQ